MASTTSNPSGPELEQLPFRIKLNAVNKGVGYVALLLPLLLLVVTYLTETCAAASISHYYFTRIGGDILVGSLSFIGLLMLFLYTLGPEKPDGYLAFQWYDPWLVRLAGVCAFLIAFVPTTGSGCLYSGEVAKAFLTGTSGSSVFHVPGDTVTGTISYDFWASFSIFGSPDAVPGILKAVHLGSAGIMFLILAYFSYFVFTRENSSASLAAGNRKSRRNRAYRVLGVIIFASVLALGVKAAALEFVLDPATAENFGKWWDGLRLTFWFEALGLVAFGLSWMIKGRFLNYYEDEAALT